MIVLNPDDFSSAVDAVINCFKTAMDSGPERAKLLLIPSDKEKFRGEIAKQILTLIAAKGGSNFAVGAVVEGSYFVGADKTGYQTIMPSRPYNHWESIG